MKIYSLKEEAMLGSFPGRDVMAKSSAQALMEALADDVTAEVRDMINKARHQGISRLEEVAKRNQDELEKRLRRLSASVKKEQEEELAAARAEADRYLLLEKRNMGNRVMERVESRLMEIRKDPRYPAALAFYVLEGVKALEEEEDFEIIVADMDRDLISQDFLQKVEDASLNELGRRVNFTLAQEDPDITVEAGLILRSKSTGLMYNNSLKRRLERLERQILLRIDEVFKDLF
jgi:vacuolar-type H+-ATPase subunit E/Vma4